MKWGRHRSPTPPTQNTGDSPELRLLNIAQSWEQFAVKLQANAEELKQIANDAAQRLRAESGHANPNP